MEETYQNISHLQIPERRLNYGFPVFCQGKNVKYSLKNEECNEVKRWDSRTGGTLCVMCILTSLLSCHCQPLITMPWAYASHESYPSIGLPMFLSCSVLNNPTGIFPIYAAQMKGSAIQIAQNVRFEKPCYCSARLYTSSDGRLVIFLKMDIRRVSSANGPPGADD